MRGVVREGVKRDYVGKSGARSSVVTIVTSVHVTVAEKVDLLRSQQKETFLTPCGDGYCPGLL